MARNLVQKALRIGVAFAVAIYGFSQTPSVKQESKDSPCSNIVALAGNVDIKCASLTPAQRTLLQGIPALLKKILANQIDPNAVMAKLDEIIENQKRQDGAINKIKARQDPWHWTSDIHDASKALLSSVPPPVNPVLLASLTESSKAVHWGILNLLIELHWPVRPSWLGMSAGPPSSGIDCVGPASDRLALDQFEKIFYLIGVPTKCRTIGTEQGINIAIGDRP